MSLRVGLTGGIGSGKSTVATRLVERGAELIDTDAAAPAASAACLAASSVVCSKPSMFFSPSALNCRGWFETITSRWSIPGGPPAMVFAFFGELLMRLWLPPA